MRDYHINIFYNAEDEVQRAKKAWLASARKEGKPIPRANYRPALYQMAS